MTLFDFDRSLELGPFSELCCVQQSAVFAGPKDQQVGLPAAVSFPAAAATPGRLCHDLCVTTRPPPTAPHRRVNKRFLGDGIAREKSEAVSHSDRRSVDRSVGRPLIVMPFHATAGDRPGLRCCRRPSWHGRPHLVILSAPLLSPSFPPFHPVCLIWPTR